MQESEFYGQRIGIISKSWSYAEFYHLCIVRVTWVDAEFGDSASPSPNGKQHIRTMCTLRAYDKGTLMGRQDTDVSRQCFTRRLTVGIAKGVPIRSYGHKKTDSRVGRFIVGLPRREVEFHSNTKVAICQVFPG